MARIRPPGSTSEFRHHRSRPAPMHPDRQLARSRSDEAARSRPRGRRSRVAKGGDNGIIDPSFLPAIGVLVSVEENRLRNRDRRGTGGVLGGYRGCCAAQAAHWISRMKRSGGSRRNREVIVRVCRYRVGYRLFSGGLGAAIFGALGTWLIVAGNVLAGIAAIAFGLLALGCALLWISEAGRVVLRITDSGVKYYDRFISWSEVRSVSLTQRRRRPDYATMTKADGTTVRILDDELDRPLDSICDEIRSRIDRRN